MTMDWLSSADDEIDRFEQAINATSGQFVLLDKREAQSLLSALRMMSERLNRDNQRAWTEQNEQQARYTLRGAADALASSGKTDPAQEGEYRRGYCDGWLMAQRAVRNDQDSTRLYDHWRGPLHKWRQGDTTKEIYPPRFGKKDGEG